MTSISPFASVCSRSPRGDTELDIAPIQRLYQHYQVTCHLSNSFLRCVRSTLLISETQSTSASICSVRAIRRGGGGEGHEREAPSACADDRDRDPGEPRARADLYTFRFGQLRTWFWDRDAVPAV